jgi:excinuclease UvrABC nuclease subunit
MKKTRFVNPFPGQVGNQRAFRQRNRPGAYIIKRGNKYLYVGFSKSDVVRAMYRHFYPWDSEQYRAVFSKDDKNIKVRVIYTNKPEQAARLEAALIKKYQPESNIKIQNAKQTQMDQIVLGSYFSAKEVTEF